MPRLLLNIDVPDIDQGIAFYTAALGLHVARYFGRDAVELAGAEIPVFLLEKPAGTPIGPNGGDTRRYERHWSPIHLDVVVEDFEAALVKAISAGAIQEGETKDAPYGRLAMFADPFGHGFCLIAFNQQGYDAMATPCPPSHS